MEADDLCQFYNELYPAEPASGENLATIRIPLRQQIVEHINAGLEPEEVVDLWSVAFPKDREVYYNEEDGFSAFWRERRVRETLHSSASKTRFQSCSLSKYAMPATALQDFNEDAARVRALIVQCRDPSSRIILPINRFEATLLQARGCLPGTLDAYFSDAYTDVVAATIISKSAGGSSMCGSLRSGLVACYGLIGSARDCREIYSTNC